MSSKSRTLLLTGLPRAGTTLCCHILNDHDNLVALHEPLTPTDFNPQKGRTAAVSQIDNFARLTRKKILQNGMALTRNKDGKVPENPVEPAGTAGLRSLDVDLNEISVASQVKDEEFILVIKHNALFSALLPELGSLFPVYGIVRNPLSVLASWHSVNLPVNEGRLPAGEMFCEQLKQQLLSTHDRIDRQLMILEWFFARFSRYLGANILRYESFVVEPEYLARSLALETHYAGSVKNRKSRNDSYNLVVMDQLYKKLMGFGDAIWQFYSCGDIDQLMDKINRQA